MKSRFKDFIIIVLVLILIVNLSFDILESSKSTIIQPNNSCFQSTTLQPSSIFTRAFSASHLTENGQTLKVDFGREFTTLYQVSDTGSMRPTFSDAAEVLAVKPAKEEIKIGDVILFKCNVTEALIIHRIIRIENLEYITKGDNNPADDTTAFGCHTKFEDIQWKIAGVIY